MLIQNSERITIHNTEEARSKQFNAAARLVTDSIWRTRVRIPGETKRHALPFINSVIFLFFIFLFKMSKENETSENRTRDQKQLMTETNRCAAYIRVTKSLVV